MTKVLFVCLGNICRSPMAEAIYKAEIAKRNLDWQIDSAATSSWEVGHSAHPGTKKDCVKQTYPARDSFHGRSRKQTLPNLTGSSVWIKAMLKHFKRWHLPIPTQRFVRI